MQKIPRIPAPVVDQIGPPVISVPSFEPPVVEGLAPPVVDIPSFEPPRYEPPVFTPEPPVVIPGLGGNQQPGQTEQIEEEARELTEQQQPEVPDAVLPDPTAGRNTVEVPYVGTIPLPTTSEVGLAGTTAVAATAAALIGKSLVEQLLKIFKPIAKKLLLKIKEKRGKQFTDYELQQYFEFEGKVPEQKQVAKRLQAEQKAEKSKQLAEHLQRQHRSK